MRRRAALAVLLVIVVAAAAAAAASRPAAPPALLAPVADDRVPVPLPPGAGDDLRRTAVVRAVEAVSPAVVNIATDRVIRREGYMTPMDFMLDRPRRWQEKSQSLGSGVVIDPQGYVLTNAHVVAQGASIHVKFRPLDGIERPEDPGTEAKVVASDPNTDVALLKIQTGGPFPFVEMGSSHDLLIGEPAIAIGNPFGFSSTVTAGVISAVNRTINLAAGPSDGMIQTDASIDPGNSGGPLLNIHGQLIGMNTAVFREARNIGFAIPVDRVKAALGNLVDPVHSNQVWTGFEVSNRGREIVVDRVAEDGPAAAAGLKPGDAVLDVEGKEPRSVFAFKVALLSKGAGEKVALQVRRQGRPEAFRVAVATAEHPALALLRARLGVEVEPMADPHDEGGVIAVRFRVTDVRKGSAADRLHVLSGDVLHSLGGVPLGSADEAAAVLRDVPRDQLVPIRLLRRTDRGWLRADTEVTLD
jgi:S1-C subfamily serine protease